MNYSDDELQQYFNDPEARRGQGSGEEPASRRFGGFFYHRIRDPKKAQAAYALSVLGGLIVLGALFLLVLVFFLGDDMPSLQELEDPTLDLSTIAYTADGRELARYGRQHRSWAAYDDISEHVIHALIATEDHRFMQHWGMDLFRTVSAVGQTVLGQAGVPGFRTQGGSTITQQLARNLYNEQIGSEVSVTRKLKEMVTAVELERRYTKREIIEMYLNTVPFGHNAYGIEAAAYTYFGIPAAELDVQQAASLIGMLQATTFYNPVRNPENAQRRRNVVMRQMVRHGLLSTEAYAEHRTQEIGAEVRSTEVTDSFAPYFAEYVRNELNRWRRQTGRDFYGEGLRVYTTLDSRMQEAAHAAVEEQLTRLQTVVDYEWSRANGWQGLWAQNTANPTQPYLEQTNYEPFAYFWEAHDNVLQSIIRNTDQYRALRSDGVAATEAIQRLRQDEAFLDSLRTDVTRLETGLVSIDPRTGEVKAWVGGRDLKTDWYDHVAISRRQPGSTFKPFVYAAAIDNGIRPTDTRRDSVYVYYDEIMDREWAPSNSGGRVSNSEMTIRQALAQSINTISAQVTVELEPSTVAFYARRMGIRSPMDKVPALSLGTSDVSLLELSTAYSTLANGGLHYEPTVITRIEDRFGNVLYEAQPSPSEALHEETAYTVVDMMRDVLRPDIDGTGQRIRWQFGLTQHDFAGKTGTTQRSADGWFMLMHPDLVTGAWVGFNDRRVTFRSSQFGQGAWNALQVVGDYTQRIVAYEDEELLPVDSRFPDPNLFRDPDDERIEDDRPERGRVGW